MQSRPNKAALVTGATSDIGMAITRHLAKAGFNLMLTGRSEDRFRKISANIEEARTKVSVFPADLGTPNGVNSLARSVRMQLEDWQSTLSVIIHVAGVWHNEQRAFTERDLVDTDIEEIESVLNASLTGAIYLTKHLLDLVPHHENAKIIGISGTFPSGGAGWLHYFVAKKGLEFFMTGLASELQRHQIQVNCVSPSYVATEPLKRFLPKCAHVALSPDEVADVIDFLLSPPAQNITGQVIVVEKSKMLPC
jgi:3-oxoacyl-[acyl-carrier protein] reductase